MIRTDKSFAENVIIAVVVDLVKSFFIFCSAIAYSLLKRVIHKKGRQSLRSTGSNPWEQGSRGTQHHEQHQNETKDTIPDEELFE